MTTYNIKYKVSKNYVEQEPNKFGWNKVASFLVVELDYTYSISLPVKEFTTKKAKAIVKAKIIEHLDSLKYDAEYTETI